MTIKYPFLLVEGSLREIEGRRACWLIVVPPLCPESKRPIFRRHASDGDEAVKLIHEARDRLKAQIVEVHYCAGTALQGWHDWPLYVTGVC